MKKQAKQKPDFLGAEVVLENYLEGAIADFRDGTSDNWFMVKSCIEAVYALNPWSKVCGDYDDVLEEVKEVEKKEEEKELMELMGGESK